MIDAGSALGELVNAAGILLRFKDVTQQERLTTPQSARALLAAMGLPAETDVDAVNSLAALRRGPNDGYAGWIVVQSGVASTLDGAGPWVLWTEDGEETRGTGQGHIALPPLQNGYHTLEQDGRRTLVIAAPRTLTTPPKSWGVTLALYGLRTAQEGGFGSYMDLAQAVEGLGQAGADFVGINPIHAGFPTDPKAFSPYSPSSRQRLSIAHIAVPGVSGSQSDLIDYMADRPAQMAALRAAFAALDPQTRAGLDSTAARDPSLHLFAVHQAIADRHGPLWPEWPTELQDPASEHVAMFAQEHAEAVAFHVWAQNMAAQQLDTVREAAAGVEMRFGLYLDLAVGTHPGGAETWAQPDAFARGVSLGAPPDAFSPGGQSWGIAPFNPRALIAQGFAPFIETLRAQFRYAKLLRIDHVLGFDRAFWVPEGDAPGAYVTMPKAALLAIARVEAARAGGWVVGEDLGNVPDGLREDMEDAGILGCRVAMFERNGTPPVYSAPATYDPLTLASFASHDLPTWKGWRAGRDLEWWAQIGHLPEDQLPIAKAERAAEVAAFDAIYGTTDGSADSLHRALALSSATLVAIQAEDMLGVTEQPNLPGTIDAHPNWRRRLPVSAAALGQNPDVLRTCALMRRDSP